jgi:hypothetical protein
MHRADLRIARQPWHARVSRWPTNRCDFGRCSTFGDVSFRHVCVFSAARGRGSDVERSRIEATSQLRSKQCHHMRVLVRKEMMHTSAHEHDRFWKPHCKRQVPAPASHVNKLPLRGDWLCAWLRRVAKHGFSPNFETAGLLFSSRNIFVQVISASTVFPTPTNAGIPKTGRGTRSPYQQSLTQNRRRHVVV